MFGIKKLIGISAFLIVLLATSSVLAAATTDKVVKQGARGDDVVYIQKLLADAGFYAGPLDGIFGTGTTNAVKEFQKQSGLPIDGVIGQDTIKFLERAGAAPSRYSRSLVMRASAYTSEDDGNGSYTYRGHQLRRGLAAVDPSVIPLGTRLYIDGYGYAIADDIGSAIKGNKIDLAFENRGDALQFGVQKVTVYILE